MVKLLFLVLIVVAIVSVAIRLSRRSATAGPAAQAPEGMRPATEGLHPAGEPSPVASARTGALASDLARWTAAGFLSREQAAAILAHEQATARAPTVAHPPSVPAPRRRVPAVAEVFGYLGGMLAIIGLVLLVAQYWPDMATAGRLALSGTGALVLFGAGALVHEEAGPALARLRAFLWLASTAATALFVGVVTYDGFGIHRTDTIALACGGAVALQSGLLWRWTERPLQQLAFLGGLAVFAGAFAAQFAGTGPVGLTVWALGVLFLLLGLRRRTPSPLLTEGAGAGTVVAGAAIITTGSWHAFGLLFLVATAFGLLALAAVPGLAPARADERVLAIVGGVVLLEAVPGTLGYFAHDAGVVTGLVTWLVGAALIVVGSRGVVRLPVVVEGLGCAALLGGAAVTGAQSQSFATIFGTATAIGMLALGTLPGRVLMLVFGSLGLLINVPWAVGWFFPGEGRAPLLVLITGVLLLAIALLLMRTGGRFRRELGGLRRPRRPVGGGPAARRRSRPPAVDDHRRATARKLGRRSVPRPT